MIDLSIFASIRIRRDYSDPWSYGEYSYATDGNMIIRVSRIADVPENREMKSRSEQTDEWLTNSTAMWFNLLPIDPVLMQKCPGCKSHGYTRPCPECEGCGTVRLESTHNEYDVDCKSCGGYGLKPTAKEDSSGVQCEDCNGAGEVLPDFNKKNTTIYGDARFSDVLLARLSVFTNAMIGPRGADEFALLKFDEGMGVIMPMRQ